MLKSHIQRALKTMAASEQQKKQLLELLVAIKNDASLRSELLHLEDHEVLDLDATKPDLVPVGDTLYFEEDSLDERSDPSQVPSAPDSKATFVDLDSDDETRSRTELSDIDTILTAEKTTSSTQAPVAEQPALNDHANPSPPTLGRYLDLGELGKGGMGEVRKVKDPVLNRELAMKIIHPMILRNKKMRSRFIEEAQIGAQLQHPSIVPIHELGTLPDGRHYFTMKEIKGREFAELIRAVHTVSTEQIWKAAADGTTFRRLIQIFHQMCETMAFAHSLGVIHRDLKPENVMIGDFGEVLIVDWGIAKVFDRTEQVTEELAMLEHTDNNPLATKMGSVSGTPAYMSPEQAMGLVDQINIQSDVYTLGAILYEILSGTPPYTGDTAIEIVEQVKTKRPPSLFLTGVDLPPSYNQSDPIALEEDNEGKIPVALIRICESAMERQIEHRTPSASVLAAEVFDWLEGAQKRDKALKEFEEANQKRHMALLLEAKHAELWSVANRILQHNGFEEENNWEKWNAASAALAEAQQLRQDYRKGLQSALVYDAELEEANEALARLLLNDIVSAVANGERQKRQVLENQFQGHLQYLSNRKQREITAQLVDNRTNNIVLSRARQGHLIGRQSLRNDVATVLHQQSRLVSLVGTAGVGKTRLALEIIYNLQEPDTNTYFCNLTEATSELSVARFVAKAMDVKLRNVDPIGQLGEVFRAQKTILVLDNLEQAIQPVGTVITRWMEQAEHLRIIATSRVRLRLEQEHSFSVQPLTVLEGIELFTKRGQQARPSFLLNEQTRQSIGRLVSQLDNLPLAIELAAARLNIFNVEEIEQRLTERFSLLRSRSGETQALQGALDWSWELLQPWAKAALSQTSVFRGGFEVQAAEHVLYCGEWKESPAVFDILQDLCDDSLLLQNKSEEGDIRFGLLESIRQYAKERLRDERSVEQNLSGPTAQLQTQNRHASHYAQFGRADHLEALDNRQAKDRWAPFLEELDNFVAGTEYGSGEDALHCCLAALKILGLKGPVSLGVDIAKTVMFRTDISDRAKKKLQILRTRFLRISGRIDEARGDKTSATADQKEVASDSPQLGDVERFLEHHRESAAMSRNKSSPPLSKEALMDLQVQADELLEQGNIEAAASRPTEALLLYNRALDIYKWIDHKRGIVESQQVVAEIHLGQGAPNKALIGLQVSLAVAKEEDLLHCVAKAQFLLGQAHLDKGLYTQAHEYFQCSLRNCQLLDNPREEALTIAKISSTLQEMGQPKEALAKISLAITIAQEAGEKELEIQLTTNRGDLHLCLGQSTQAQSHFNHAIQLADSLGNQRGKGRALHRLGLSHLLFGDFNEAVRLHQQALLIAQDGGYQPDEADYNGHLAVCHHYAENTAGAIKHFKTAIQQCKDSGHHKSEGLFTGLFGELLSEMGRLNEAKKRLTEARSLLHNGHPSISNYFASVLAWVQVRLYDHTEAIALFEQPHPVNGTYVLPHIKMLCHKAKVYHLAQNLDQAQQALAQAKQLFERLRLKHTCLPSSDIQATDLLLQTPPPSMVVLYETPLENLNPEDFEDLRLEADDLLEQGNIEETESFYKKAFQLYCRALIVYNRINHHKGVIQAYQKIGMVYYYQSHYDNALRNLEIALKMAEEKGLFLLRAKVYASLGTVYQNKGEYQQALDLHKRALAINRSVENRFGVTYNLGNLGVVYQFLGQYEEAIAHYTQSIKIAQEIGDKRTQGRNLGSLGNVHSHLGQYEQALAHYQQAIHLAKDIGDKRTQAGHLGNLGNVCRALGQYEQAIEHYQQARHIAQEIGDSKTEGNNLGSLGIIYEHLGQYTQAIEHYQQAIKTAKDIGDKSSEGITHGNLGNLCRFLGKYELSLAHYNQAIKIARIIGNKRSEGINLGNLGESLRRLERWEEATSVLDTAIAICEGAIPPAAGAFSGTLALVYAQQDRFTKAFELLEHGETLVSVHRLEYGKFLCKKAMVFHLNTQPVDSQDVLSQAKNIALQIKAKDNSDLGQAIREVETLLTSAPTPPT